MYCRVNRQQLQERDHTSGTLDHATTDCSSFPFDMQISNSMQFHTTTDQSIQTTLQQLHPFDPSKLAVETEAV